MLGYAYHVIVSEKDSTDQLKFGCESELAAKVLKDILFKAENTTLNNTFTIEKI